YLFTRHCAWPADVRSVIRSFWPTPSIIDRQYGGQCDVYSMCDYNVSACTRATTLRAWAMLLTGDGFGQCHWRRHDRGPENPSIVYRSYPSRLRVTAAFTCPRNFDGECGGLVWNVHISGHTGRCPHIGSCAKNSRVVTCAASARFATWLLLNSPAEASE